MFSCFMLQNVSLFAKSNTQVSLFQTVWKQLAFLTKWEQLIYIRTEQNLLLVPEQGTEQSKYAVFLPLNNIFYMSTNRLYRLD